MALVATCVTAAAGSPAAIASGTLPPISEYDALLVSASDPSAVLLGTQHGLFRSADGGRSWTVAGLHGDPVTSLSRAGKTILAAGPRLLAASTDGGRTWGRLQPRGLPNDVIDALGANRSTIDVVLRGAGLYRSTDGGRTFAPVSVAVGPAIRALALTSTRLIAGDVTSGVYVSPNGRDWLHTANGMIMALAAGADDRVLAASWGIARSSDGGRRWRIALHSHVMFGAVAWAPTDRSLAYAVGDDGSFWMSTDGGLRWREMTGSQLDR
jgi:photosystem II stability/assembly factor-like uncharacterized protein